MNATQRTHYNSPDQNVTSGDRPPAAEDYTVLRVHADSARESRSQRSLGDRGTNWIFEFAGRYFAVPHATGPVCLADEQQRSSPWILSADTLEELHRHIDDGDVDSPALQHVEQFFGYDLFVQKGLYYGVESRRSSDQFRNGPATEGGAIVEPSLADLRKRVLHVKGIEIPGQILGTCESFVLTRAGDTVRAFPLKMGGAGYLSKLEQVAAGVIQGKTQAEVEQAIRHPAPTRDVEFGGWLPAFTQFGNCGTHPQFGHTDVPPAGYAFIQSPRPPASGLAIARLKRLAGKAIRYARVGRAMGRLSLRCLAAGAGLRETLDFLQTRHFESQVQLPRRNRLLFLTSVPYTYGQDPWIIEIEDLTSLLFPYVDNGCTGDLDIEQAPGFRAIKALLEDDNCRGIVTHIRETAEGISRFFQSDKIAGKTTHIPMGVRLPPVWQTHEPSPTINLLFTNSWHQNPDSFYLRGGLDVLEAFSSLHGAYPELRLTLRTALPADLPEYYRRIIDDCDVTVLDAFLEPAELERLMLSSHALLLPSGRIHVMSVLQAMAYGLVPVVSDGWGMREYVEHRRTGLVVRGRFGKVTWNDPQNGMLREEYSSLYEGDSRVAQSLINELSQLADNADWRREIGHAARREVQTKFNLANWNVGLKAALDRAWTEK